MKTNITTPAVSVIIPVYNSGKYLKRCVDSVLAQGISELEIIIVNDGSTDGSGLICDRIADAHAGIKVIHTANHGVSQARNTGILSSSGRYLLFLDSDDSMIPPSLHRALQDPALSAADLIIGGYARNNMTRINSDCISDNPALDFLMNKIDTQTGAWIVKRELLITNNLAYNTAHRYGEDTEFLLRCLMYADYVAVDSHLWMRYEANPESAMHKTGPERFDVVKSRQELLTFALETGNNAVAHHLRRETIPMEIINVSTALPMEGASLNCFLKALRIQNVREAIETCLSDGEVTEAYRNTLRVISRFPTFFFLKHRGRRQYYAMRAILGHTWHRLKCLIKPFAET